MKTLGVVFWLVAGCIGYGVQAYVLPRIGLQPLGVGPYALASFATFTMAVLMELGTALFKAGGES